MSFPLNPDDNQQTIKNGIKYNYSAITNSWRRDYNNALDQLFIVGDYASNSTTTGALVVFGGVGIGGDVYIGGNLNVLSTGTTTFAGDIMPLGNINLGSAANPFGTIYLSGNTLYLGSVAIGSSDATSNLCQRQSPGMHLQDLQPAVLVGNGN